MEVVDVRARRELGFQLKVALSPVVSLDCLQKLEVGVQ